MKRKSKGNRVSAGATHLTGDRRRAKQDPATESGVVSSGTRLVPKLKKTMGSLGPREKMTPV